MGKTNKFKKTQSKKKNFHKFGKKDGKSKTDVVDQESDSQFEEVEEDLFESKVCF